MKDTIINLQLPLYAEIHDYDDDTESEEPQSIVRRVESMNISSQSIWFNNGFNSRNFTLLEQDLDTRPFKKRWAEVDKTEATQEPVVRCGECKHWVGEQQGFCVRQDLPRPPDYNVTDFCSYGERRTE